MSSFSDKEYSDMCDKWRKLHDLSMASLREAMDEVVRLEKDRDEWIARFRADEQPIKKAMEKHEWRTNEIFGRYGRGNVDYANSWLHDK